MLKKIMNMRIQKRLLSSSILNYYQSFTDAIASIFDKQKAYFKTIKIFAYSAKNYIHYFQTSNMKVENLKLCLHRANDYSAWFMNSITHVQKYQNKLKIHLQIH